MKDEYDFAGAERGRFFRAGAELVPPVHLDPEVLAFLAPRAATRGPTSSEFADRLLPHGIATIEADE